MNIRKEEFRWPREYEPPRLVHIQTAYQQALGVSYCSPVGNNASGGTGSCGAGNSAAGTPGDPNACKAGNRARIGPGGGGGNSPCGQGHQACANG